MHTKTTVMVSPHLMEDRIWLNRKEQSLDNPRLECCLKEIRKRSSCEWKVHVCSENNFPTAAGLASSAAGYACLVFALAKAFNVTSDVSGIARQGSGSACRSIFGGFVQWCKGENDDGSDSFAKQLFPENHWPELRVLILVVSESQKKTSSTVGMQKSVETSELLQYRVSKCVPERVKCMINAIESKDFSTFGNLTMQDSNQFHAICLDTFPPAVYMNDISHSIVALIHNYNKMCGTTKVAYTFDAGPNACLYLEEQNVPEVLALILHAFPPLPDTENYVKGIPVQQAQFNHDALKFEPYSPGCLKYIIHTKVGDGPKVLTDEQEHLLNTGGMPKYVSP